MFRVGGSFVVALWLVACEPAAPPPTPDVVPAAPVAAAPAPVASTPAPAAAPSGLAPANADKLGPDEGDPTVMGDEIPAGGWAKDGVIYDAKGGVYGCTSGGNDCMGPPPG